MARFGRRYPIQPVIKRNVVAAPAVAAPVPPPLTNWKAAVQASSRRHALNRGRSFFGGKFQVPGIIFPAVLRVSPGLTFVHEINDDNPRTRKALQQLSDTFNNLKRSGELSGTFANPALGYVPANTADWGGDEPGTIREALNKIAAALTDLGVNLGDY